MCSDPGNEKLSNTDLYFVLIGRVGRCTIWPCSAQVPVGWQVVFGPDTHDRCVAYAERRRGSAAEEKLRGVTQSG